MVTQQAAPGMNRWTRVNLALALLAASLLLAHLWPGDATDLRPLTELGEAEVSQIRVERADRLRLALQRNEKGWEMTHPHKVAAVERRVQQLLAIARAPVQHEFPADPAPARYGFDKPGAVLQLNGLRLRFGERDPSQNSRYVLVYDRIRVIDDLYYNLLSLPASHYTGN